MMQKSGLRDRLFYSILMPGRSTKGRKGESLRNNISQ